MTARFADRATQPARGPRDILRWKLGKKEPQTHLTPSFSAPVMLLIDMVREGQGITWAPRSLVQDEAG